MSRGVVLSDSLEKPRPEFSAFLTIDNDINRDTPQDVRDKRNPVEMKYPGVIMRNEPESFKMMQDPTDPSYKKFNDIGMYRVAAPNRSSDSMLDPCSGFVSVSVEVVRSTGRSRLPTMVQLNDTPQSYNPRESHTIRMAETAPPDTRRKSERDPGVPYRWNSRKVHDGNLRAGLGGSLKVSWQLLQ